MRKWFNIRVHVVSRIFVWTYAILCLAYFLLAINLPFPVTLEQAAAAVFGFLLAAWADDSAHQHEFRKTVLSRVGALEESKQKLSNRLDDVEMIVGYLEKDMDWVEDSLRSCVVHDGVGSQMRGSSFLRPER